MNTFSIWQNSRPTRARPRRSRWLFCSLWITVCLLAGAGGSIYLLGYLSETVALADRPFDPVFAEIAVVPQAEMEAHLARLRKKNARIAKAITSLNPRGPYIVIDTARNRLYLMEKDRIIREAVCSTGSGLELKDPRTNRKWVFDTPQGEFDVRGKLRYPLWRKPDWAFIEEGQPVPENDEDRFERGYLGKFGLAFGNGYFIHGTLYTRFLGLSVTHGCVRLGGEDLESVYASTPENAKILIF